MTHSNPEMVELDDRHGAVIRSTVILPPLEQVDALVSLFAASKDDAPTFAALLIGELVLTRMRLVACSAAHIRDGAAS